MPVTLTPPVAVSAGGCAAAPLLVTCLEEAAKALDSLGRSPSKNDPHIAWMERQLNHLISQLQAMLCYIESGVPLDSGVWDQLDLLDMLEESMAEIRNLKSLIQSLRAISR